MARNLNDIMASLPADEQAEIEARYQDLKQEVEGLRELRQIAGKAQADIATALNIKQPSVSKIEKQAICTYQLSGVMSKQLGENWN